MGNWSLSKYQPKCHGSMTAGAILPSASRELSPVAEHAVSDEYSPELSKSNAPLHSDEPFNPDDSGLGPSIDGKEADAINEADIQAFLLTDKGHDGSRWT